MITGGGINEGNGVYKSTDAGTTWQHLGLDATKQIPSILVDPRDPNVVLVAAQGDVHAKSDERGVFRSTDGGATWTQTLFVNDSTGHPEDRERLRPPGRHLRDDRAPLRRAAAAERRGELQLRRAAAGRRRARRSSSPSTAASRGREITGSGLPAPHRQDVDRRRDEHERAAHVLIAN